MSGHTPGPWKVKEEHGDLLVVAGEHKSYGYAVRYEIATNLGGKPSERKANANLIAAAPELLALSRAAMKFINASTAENFTALRDLSPHAVIARAGSSA